MIFRFDDVSINTDMEKLEAMTDIIQDIATVEYSISITAKDMGTYTDKHKEFVFMPIWKAYSDHRKFYGVDSMGIPDVACNVIIASHGIVHVDHRWMHRDAQELSIVLSCNLLECKTFVPPFNKWNEDTEWICKKHDIELQKFEDGWLSAEYNKYNVNQQLWYAHPFNWTVDKFKEWLGA